MLSYNLDIPYDFLPKNLQSLICQGDSIQFISLPHSKLTHLEINLENILGSGIIPNFVKKLILTGERCSVEKDTIPNSVTKLIYNEEELKVDILPNSIQKLYLDNTNQLEPGMIPPYVKKLKLGTFYDNELKKGVLPDSLEDFDCGFQNVHPINPGVLPQSLKKITFSSYFVHPLLPGSLPPSITDLYFISNVGYQHPIGIGVLPESLKKMTLYDICPDGIPLEKPIIVIPPSVEELDYGMASDLTGDFPKLKKLSFLNYGSNYLNLVIPPSVETFTFDSTEQISSLPEGFIPSTVKVLKLNSVEQIKVGTIPNSVRTLYIYGSEFRVERNSIPDSVTELSYQLRQKNNQELLNVVPSSVGSLQVDMVPDQDILVIPKSVQKLIISSLSLSFFNKIKLHLNISQLEIKFFVHNPNNPSQSINLVLEILKGLQCFPNLKHVNLNNLNIVKSDHPYYLITNSFNQGGFFKLDDNNLEAMVKFLI
eukprot:gene7914-9740_t